MISLGIFRVVLNSVKFHQSNNLSFPQLIYICISTWFSVHVVVITAIKNQGGLASRMAKRLSCWRGKRELMRCAHAAVGCS